MSAQNENHVVAELRTEFGKGFARRTRAAGKIPAVIYGHGTEPRHVSLPGHEVGLIVRKSNQVLELDINGDTQLALVKDVQKDPVRQIIEHIDLLVVKKGEKVSVDIPIHLEGETASGTMYNFDTNTVSLEVEATHIPESVVVSIEGLEEGAQITAGDLVLPKGASLVSEPDTLIVGVISKASVAAANDAAGEDVAAEVVADDDAE